MIAVKRPGVTVDAVIMPGDGELLNRDGSRLYWERGQVLLVPSVGNSWVVDRAYFDATYIARPSMLWRLLNWWR